MRQLTDKIATEKFLEFLGSNIKGPGKLYLTGGASAVLIGWRDRTVDIDCKFDPEPLGVFEAIQEAKLKLDINVELAAPDHFIPPLPQWMARSKFIGLFGKLEVYHYDFYAQALSKIERNHDRDIKDVEQMVTHGLINRQEIGTYFKSIASDLLRYPGINQTAFAEKVQRFLRGGS